MNTPDLNEEDACTQAHEEYFISTLLQLIKEGRNVKFEDVTDAMSSRFATVPTEIKNKYNELSNKKVRGQPTCVFKESLKRAFGSWGLNAYREEYEALRDDGNSHDESCLIMQKAYHISPGTLWDRIYPRKKIDKIREKFRTKSKPTGDFDF